MEYSNYIFDLYGTLVDVHTDEGKPELWRGMAGWYSSYGADWTPKQLQKSYWAFVREEEQKLAAELGCSCPEIKLETVFLRLLNESPAGHRSSKRPAGAEAEGLWTQAAANMFRALSRDRLRCFDGVPELLESLKAQGRRVFLLSNAQSIFTIPELEQCGIAGCFDDIFISSERGIKKPEPRFLKELMQKHSMDPAATVMIGNDPLTDMAVAKACGVAGILVDSEGRDIAALQIT